MYVQGNVLTNQRKTLGKEISNNIFVYILLAPGILATLIFSYLPLIGILMAFQDYDMFRGFFGSHWVGLQHFKDIFVIPQMLRAIGNTFIVSLLSIIIAFPLPIILSILFNEMSFIPFKRTIQTLSYLPHFLSWIAVIGIAYNVLSVYGPINNLRIALLGSNMERIMFLEKQELFVPMVLLITVWKETGWSCILFLAAISSIDAQLYEAAWIDGASKCKQMINITIPGIMPTVVVLLILKLGQVFGSNFELIYGLQNPFIDYDVISTIVYKYGIQQGNYSISTALGFMQGLVALLLTMGSNWISDKISGVAIW